MLHAAAAAGVVIVLGVELLSRFALLRPVPVAVLAMAVAAAAVAAARAAWPAREPGRDAVPTAIVVALAVVGVVTLAIAVVAAPNTWDSMTYHLPRVAHWAASGSVAHYPTSIDRQLWQPPFAEFLVLVLWILGGGDRLANLPAWLAAAGCVVAAVETTRLLGGGRRTRAIAALVAATIPPLVLQATSTQTDVVAALWLGAAASFALAEYARPTTTWRAFGWLGAALGLAIGTKGTALPLGLPWVAVALGPAMRARAVRRAALGTAVIALAVVGLNGFHWMRNLLVFNGPLGPSTVQQLLRPAGLDPATVVGNLAANVAIHLGTPWPTANAAVAGAVRALHGALGLDANALYPFFGGYRVDPWTTHENVAGSPGHLVLAIVGAGLVAATWTRRRGIERAYALAVAGCVLLLAASVRWQPFNARLHLPLFVLLAPGIAITIARLGSRAGGFALGVLTALALPALFVNATRPVVVPPWPALAMPGVRSVFVAPRLEQYFAGRRDAMAAYAHLPAAARAAGCATIGVKTGYDGWEYPAWIVLGRPLEHVLVDNASTEIATPALPPAWCLLAVDVRPDWTPRAEPRRFARLWSEGPLSLWR